MKFISKVIVFFLKKHRRKVYLENGRVRETTYVIFRGLEHKLKEEFYIEPPLHVNCRCAVVPLEG